MKRVLIDTNIWLDLVLHRPGQPFAWAAVMACIDEPVDMMICATSLKDVFYLARKAHGADGAYDAIRKILALATPAAVDQTVCTLGLNYEVPDYEDGILTACALAEHADAVITRDKASFAGHPFKRMTPEEFVKALGYTEIPL